MQKAHLRDFTQGNITSQLITFSLPLFLSNLLQVVYNMVDMVVVGNVLGNTGVSAVAIGGDVSALLMFVAMGFSNAGQVIIARLIGAKQTDKLGRFVGTMSGFLFAGAALISVIALIFQPTLLRWMKTPDEAWDGAMAYSSIMMSGLVFTYGYNAVSAILRGMGDSKHPFVFISVVAVMNLVLDIIFVAWWDMGPGGAALATILSQAVSFLACVVFLYHSRTAFRLDIRWKDFICWDGAMLKDLILLGAPMAIKTASIQVSKLFVNSWINSYGLAVSAFAGIANKISSVANLVSAAMNTAGSTVVGQNIAAGKYERVKQVMLAVAKLTLTVAVILSLAFVFFSEPIFGLFTKAEDEAAVQSIAGEYVPIAVLLFFGAAMRSIMNALINGSGHYKINFATAILDGIVMRIGLALLFGLALDMKHYGFWLGDALAGFTPFWIGLAFYFSGQWKNPVKK
ncbi:MAG: MATE family efflux transporter [Clostridia bacterium]|nr:MATE family efflux transporter [Clostridia bacterium]